MLRKTLLTVLAMTLVIALPIPAQEPLIPVEEELPYLTLEEILRNYYGAIGGDEAWADIDSMKMDGLVQMGPGMDLAFVVYTSRPDQMRLEFTTQGLLGVQAIDGEQAWLVDLGGRQPRAMPEDLEKRLRRQLDIEGPLIDWSAKGHLLEVLEAGESLGRDAYRIKMTRDDGTVETYHFDAETFRLFLVEGTTTLQGTEVESETLMSNFNMVGDGLMLAHTIESRIKGRPGGQVIKVETVEIGLDVSAVQFAMPTAAAPETADE